MRWEFPRIIADDPKMTKKCNLGITSSRSQVGNFEIVGLLPTCVRQKQQTPMHGYNECVQCNIPCKIDHIILYYHCNQTELAAVASGPKCHTSLPKGPHLPSRRPRFFRFWCQLPHDHPTFCTKRPPICVQTATQKATRKGHSKGHFCIHR